MFIGILDSELISRSTYNLFIYHIPLFEVKQCVGTSVKACTELTRQGAFFAVLGRSRILHSYDLKVYNKNHIFNKIIDIINITL